MMGVAVIIPGVKTSLKSGANSGVGVGREQRRAEGGESKEKNVK